MTFFLSPLDEESARAVVRWTYDPPYDFYNFPPGNEEKDVRYLVDPANGLYGVRTAGGELVAFCSYGADAQVPGGDYSEPALDVGLGMRPDLTGQGKGAAVIRQVLGFGAGKFHPERFRVTIASFNTRARRAWESAGFGKTSSFSRKSDGSEFLIYIRQGIIEDAKEE